MKSITKSTINLFRAVPIESKKKKTDKKLMEKTIQKGFIFSPEIVYNYQVCDSLIKLVEKTVGITAEKLNSSFHKSWVKVKEADIEQLVVEQIAHYLTTYGKESPEEYIEEKGEQWGVDNLGGKIIGLKDFKSDKVGGSYVYIPKEKLEIPDLDIDGIKLTIIKGYTKKELKEKLLDLLGMGVALGEDTIKDVVDVAVFVGINENDIDNIKNKEVKIALYDHLKMLPENPVEFLRFIVFKATESTLLIKSSDLINKIKETDNKKIVKLFNDYESKYGLNRLAEIFYRFKPIFLSFRTNSSLRYSINKIRRLAIRYHKPMPVDYLNDVTSKLKAGKIITKSELDKELDKVTTFRKIRLAYALRFRTKKDIDSIMYKIRNGKAFSTSFAFENKSSAKRILNIVTDSIVKDISKNVKGKKIYIPEHINYSLPATEKQFTGNFPSGTSVTIPKDMIVGINWANVKSKVIDLDLSVISPDEKIGWDADYRTDSGDILFSGDITDAKGANGATELFYIKRQVKKALILLVNYYNFNSDVEVPFKIIVAKEKAEGFGGNYMVNPNNLISVAESKINQKQKILGLIVTTSNESRFYFAEAYIGKSISSSDSEFVKHSRKYLFDFYENSINLKDILKKAGAKLITDKDKADISLLPEELEKDTILNLLK